MEVLPDHRVARAARDHGWQSKFKGPPRCCRPSVSVSLFRAKRRTRRLRRPSQSLKALKPNIIVLDVTVSMVEVPVVVSQERALEIIERRDEPQARAVFRRSPQPGMPPQPPRSFAQTPQAS